MFEESDTKPSEGNAFRQRFEDLACPVLRSAHVAAMDHCIQHGNTTTLSHCMGVAYYSLLLVTRFHIGCDPASLVRGALLHDYFLYDWHDRDSAHRLHGFRHPGFALANAERDFDLSPVERDLIAHHMFPLTPVPPRHVAGVVVCLVDKACSLYEVFARHTYPALTGMGVLA